MRADSLAPLSVDSRSLDGLRNEAVRNPAGAARRAAVQFESLFMQMVLKSMRDATPKADGSSGEGDTFAAMLDAQFARQFAGRPHGLADVIEQQLTRHMQNLPASGEAAAPAASPAPFVIPAKAGIQGVLANAKASDSRLRGNDGHAAPAPPEPTRAPAAPRSREAAFIEAMLPHARQAERRTGVPASYILGQAALESGWGRREIPNGDGTPSFNLFGIKAGASWTGATTQVATTEFEHGRPQRGRALFRSYDSYAQAFEDYARLIATQPRYAAARQATGSPETFAGGMQRGGYASDPQYADKLARTINQTLALRRALG